MTTHGLHLRHFGRMRTLFDGRVTVGAAQVAVNAGCVLGGIDGKASATVGLHSRLAVAGQAAFVLFSADAPPSLALALSPELILRGIFSIWLAADIFSTRGCKLPGP
jgi:hypothetical protein